MVLGQNSAGTDRLYVVNRLDNSLSIFDPNAETHVESLPLGNDPTPRGVKDGREFIYSAELSGTGFVSCASCHTDARTDALSWRLGNPQGLPPAQNAPDRAFILSLMGAGTFPGPISDSVFQALMYAVPSFDPDGVDDKREMVTQSLQGLSTWEARAEDREFFSTAPFHWRGDKETVGDFNEAFVALLLGTDIGTPGEPQGLTGPEVESMETFVHSLTYPPNPQQPKERVFSTGPEGGQLGKELFHEKDFSLLSDRSCVHCHSLPSGSNGRLTVFVADPVQPGFVTEVNRQPMESAAMRGLLQKEPLLEPDGRFDQVLATTPRVGHFGLNHQGNLFVTGINNIAAYPAGNLTTINTFIDVFILGQGENRTSPDSHALKQFAHEFDWGLGPVIGDTLQIRQTDLTDTAFLINVAGPAVGRMQDQAAQANASVVAWVETPGGATPRQGFRFYPSAGVYLEEPNFLAPARAAIDLLSLLVNPEDSVIFTAVPLGSERRVASSSGRVTNYLMATPTGVELLPMRPNTAYRDVPTFRENWVPQDAPAVQTAGIMQFFDFREFATVDTFPDETSEVYTKQLRLMQYGLMQAPNGPNANDYGVNLLRHEAPRRLRVAASGIVTGARLLLSFPAPGPGYTGLPPTNPAVEQTIPRRTLELPLFATGEFENGKPVWETAVELDPEMAYTLMLGGPDAPGVGWIAESVALHSVEIPSVFPGAGPTEP